MLALARALPRSVHCVAGLASASELKWRIVGVAWFAGRTQVARPEPRVARPGGQAVSAGRPPARVRRRRSAHPSTVGQKATLPVGKPAKTAPSGNRPKLRQGGREDLGQPSEHGVRTVTSRRRRRRPALRTGPMQRCRLSWCSREATAAGAHLRARGSAFGCQ